MTARVVLGWVLIVALFGAVLGYVARLSGEWRATLTVVGITAGIASLALLAGWLITGSLS